MPENFVSVVLPAYNERDNVISLIAEIHVNLGSYLHEIILVDDNSPDGTYRAASDLNLPYLKVILRKEDKGLANSIRCGIENSQGNVVIVMDSDFNHDPGYIPFMVDALKYYDCVTASRFLYGGGMDSRVRHLASWSFNIFVRVFTGGRINDNLYGFFAIKKKALEKTDYDKIFWGYGDYYLRLLYFLQRAGIRILQFPAVNGRRRFGQEQSHLVRIFLQYSGELLKFAFNARFRHV